MNKQLPIVLILVFICFASCKSSQKARANKKTTSTTLSKPQTEVENIVDYAKTFKGVRYKWGGTTKSGMDCSGLVYESFRAHNISLPRVSRDMAKKGTKIRLKEVQEGDLLFFKTKKRGGHAINHVGLVTKASSKTIEFIHSTSSKGVIITKFSETYWNNAFVEARRIL